jgi:DNA-binding winged helix-turn-helix (wHTH) protein
MDAFKRMGAHSVRVLFGDCVFEREARRLTRAGEPVRLTPKALLLLECLLDRRHAVVSQQELRDVLWPGTFVGMNSLSQVVVELRRAVGSHGRDLIRMAYGAGYAFDGEVVEDAEPPGPAAPEPPRFLLRWGAVEIPLHAGENVLGRDTQCGCRIESSRVSRRHARILLSGGKAVIQDLGSKNGTHLRGRRVDGPTSLAHGDVILLGGEVVLFSAVGPLGTTETDVQPAGRAAMPAGRSEG